MTLPEGKTLEFKRDLSALRNVLRTLVAFAISAGGQLVLGVDDPLAEEERLCNLIADQIAPPFTVARFVRIQTAANIC